MKELGGGAFAKELKVLKKVIQNLEVSAGSDDEAALSVA